MLLSLLSIATLGMAAAGFEADSPAPQDLSGTSDTTVTKVKFDPNKWQLEWGDEFDKDGLPDPNKWDYEEGYIRNNEAQYYTKGRKENARVENGKLVIEARMDNWNGKKITSASVVSRGKKWMRYGRIEVRAKLPTGRGTWPAIWTLGKNIDQVGWPKCGELDIMENVGFDPDVVHSNVHVDKYNHTKGNGKGNRVPAKPYADFNVYAVEWWPDRVEFFFNDLRYLVYKNEKLGESSWPFDQDHYLILNLAIGGAWGGSKGVDEALLPHKFEIDYVRYYKPKR